MAKYFGTNTTAESVTISRSKDTRIVRAMWLGGWYAVLRQTTTTETVHYEGVSESDARTLCTSSESSTLNGTTRAYLGGATVTQSGIGAAWMHCDDCWGTRVSSSMRRMGLSRMYEVDVTTETMDVSAGSGTLTKT